MGKYSEALKKLQSERLEVFSKMEGGHDPGDSDLYFDLGYLSGIEKAEEILYALQKKTNENGRKLWYTGSPNDIKPNNCGTYILIMRAHFNSDDDNVEIKEGDIKIDADYWDGENWESFVMSDEEKDRWEVLYFTKLKWLMFPIPEELGVKRSDSMFF